MDNRFIPDETTSKLMILYAMNELDFPLTENSIVDVCTSRNNWVQYMEYKTFLDSMLQTELVLTMDKETKEPRYYVGPKGLGCLKLFSENIPISVREEIEAFAQNYGDDIKLGQENVYEYNRNHDDSYTVKLKIKDVGTDEYLLELNVKVPSRENALYICKNWIHTGEHLYEYVYRNLVEVKENDFFNNKL